MDDRRDRPVRKGCTAVLSYEIELPIVRLSYKKVNFYKIEPIFTSLFYKNGNFYKIEPESAPLKVKNGDLYDIRVSFQAFLQRFVER